MESRYFVVEPGSSILGFATGQSLSLGRNPDVFFHFCWYGWNMLEPCSRLTVTSWKVAPEATHFSIKFRHSINMNCWFCSLRGFQKKNHVPHCITSKRLVGKNTIQSSELDGVFHEQATTAWWFGTFFIFPYIGNSNPTWLIFFRGVETTNQINTSATNTALRHKAARLRISSRDLTESAEKITFLGCWVWWGFSQHKQGFFTNQHRWLTRKNGDLSRKNGDLTKKKWGWSLFSSNPLMFYQPDLSNINLGWMWEMFKKKRRTRIRFEFYGCFKQSTCEVQRGAGYVIASGTSRIWITHNQIGRQIITINSYSYLQNILEARKFITSVI